MLHTGFPLRWQRGDKRSIFLPLLRLPALWDYGTTVRSSLNFATYLQIQSHWSLGFQHTNGKGTIQSIAEISVAMIISIFQISQSSEWLPDSLEISQLDSVAGPGSQASWPRTPRSAPYTRCFVLTQQPHGSKRPQMISLATLSFGSAQCSPRSLLFPSPEQQGDEGNSVLTSVRGALWSLPPLPPWA